MSVKRPISMTLLTNDASALSFRRSLITMPCEKLLSLRENNGMDLHGQELPNYLREFFIQTNLTSYDFQTFDECVSHFQNLADRNHLLNNSHDLISTSSPLDERSRSLIIFVTLIALVSLISILGNLCLAKVLYAKRFRLIQTDRIVLCLALSELCLVLIDSPIEIYRFLSYSFTQQWLCRSHTFFEALFSSCIIYYHLLGAFDRFVYIHGHTSSRTSSWSKWSRQISTKSGSILLLIIPFICSLPLAICNCLHANILEISSTKKSCILQYQHNLIISLLIVFYILPIIIAFILHGKLIYFIHSRHHQLYLTNTTYVSTMKRHHHHRNECQVKRDVNQEPMLVQNQVSLSTNNSSFPSRRQFLMNTNANGSISTTTTTAILQLTPKNSSNTSQTSRSSTGTNSTSTTSPIVLYKINSQANVNANRTILLLILLLSFYVFCWAPYNLHTWYHIYGSIHKSSNRPIELPGTTSSLKNFNANLRRLILINYALYLLSMISMCFSFIFYFSMNKQAREELSRLTGCSWPCRIRSAREKSLPQRQKEIKQLQYRTRYPNPKQYLMENERVKYSRPLLLNERYAYMKRTNYPENLTSKKTVLNYGCQIQCCP